MSKGATTAPALMDCVGASRGSPARPATSQAILTSLTAATSAPLIRWVLLVGESRCAVLDSRSRLIASHGLRQKRQSARPRVLPNRSTHRTQYCLMFNTQ